MRAPAQSEARWQQRRLRFDLWQSQREKAEVLASGLRVLRGESRGTLSSPAGLPTVMIWSPKAIKPYANYRFHNEAQREAYIAQQVENYLGTQRRLAERKAARAGQMQGVKLEEVSVGDIFDYCWGYDQSNVEFFQVVAKRGRRVVIRELAQSTVPGSQGFMSESVLPIKDRFLEGREAKTQTKLVQWTEDGRAYLAQPYGWCDKWRGTPQYASHYA